MRTLLIAAGLMLLAAGLGLMAASVSVGVVDLICIGSGAMLLLITYFERGRRHRRRRGRQ